MSDESAIDHLRSTLTEAIRFDALDVRWAETEFVRQERIKIQRSHGAAAMEIDESRLRRELLALASDGVPREPRRLRDCLGALAVEIPLSDDDEDPDTWAAIDDPIVFDDLMAAVRAESMAPKWRERCMAALLRSYFIVDGPDDARSTGQQSSIRSARWRTISGALAQFATEASDGGRLGPLLRKHVSVFADSPTDAFGGAVLDGNVELIDEVRSDLAIPEASWFWRELLLAQARALGDRPFTEFARAWPPLLEQAQNHPSVLDEVLGAILNRYVRHDGADVNDELRELAFDRWKNPMAETNRTRWLAYVEPETLRKVQLWIKLSLIEAFFEFLADDPGSDPLRPAFWKRYAGSIDDMVFFLSEAAAASRNPKLQKLRVQMAGNVRLLAHRDTNAFAMVIRDHVYVEFSKYSNAAFVHKKSRLNEIALEGRSGQLSLRGGNVAGGSVPVESLKREEEMRELWAGPENLSTRNRWTHQGHWQANFTQRIQLISRVSPDSKARRR